MVPVEDNIKYGTLVANGSPGNKKWSLYTSNHMLLCLQPSLGSNASRSQGTDRSNESKKAANAVINDPSKSSQSRSMPSVGTGTGQIFSDIGLYKGVVIALKHIKKDHIQVTRQVLLEFNEVSVRCVHTHRQYSDDFSQISFA